MVAGTPQFAGGGLGLVLEYDYQIFSDPLDLSQVLADITNVLPDSIHDATFLTSAGLMTVNGNVLGTTDISLSGLSSTNVPEPAPLALLGLGLMALVFSRRNKHMKNENLDDVIISPVSFKPVHA